VDDVEFADNWPSTDVVERAHTLIESPRAAPGVKFVVYDCLVYVLAFVVVGIKVGIVKPRMFLFVNFPS